MRTTMNTRIDQATVVQSARAVGEWQLDADRSTVRFAVKNFWGLMTVEGRFTRVDGFVDVHDDGALAATLTVDAASVDTGNAKRDVHLRSKDFFDVEHFADMVVRIDHVDLASAGEGTAHGRMTVLGETRPVEVALRIDSPSTDGAAVVHATTTVDRAAFGMTWRPMKMAALEVHVDAELVFRKTS